MNRVLVVGAGAVGVRAARQLVAPGVEVLVASRRRARADEVARAVGATAVDADPAGWAGRRPDVVVLATPGGHAELATAALGLGAHVVSTADSLREVRALAGEPVSAAAAGAGRTVVVGAGFAPGLTCLLTVHAAALFDTVDEVHVARAGTGGPACARAHHRSLRDPGVDWRDGGFVERPSGSGRELVWFPDPVGGVDCYRAGLGEPLLLRDAVPAATRITARLAASRRDRLTSRLPMLRPPHAEGLLGAVRVEVRGRRGGVPDALVYGAVDRPALAAGTVAAVAAVAAADGTLRAGVGGLAHLATDVTALLQALAHRGVRAAVFEGG